MIDESGNSMRYINKVDLLIIARNMSLLMIGIGLLCLVPIIVDLIFLEFNAISYLIPALISIFLKASTVIALKPVCESLTSTL